MTAEVARPTRREQRREQTLREIKALAMEQIAASGPDGVSLNAVARSMAMSPAALYRYFDSRDALLADLVVMVYDDLADTLEAAGRAAGAPDQRLAVVVHACRDWALANPNPYRLIFQTTSGSGADLAPERTIPAAARSMKVILTALADSAQAQRPESTAERPAGVDARLGDQVRAWAARTQMPDLPVGLLTLGLTCWTRLHGVISLELGHHLASTGVDPALLYESEVRTIILASQQTG